MKGRLTGPCRAVAHALARAPQPAAPAAAAACRLLTLRTDQGRHMHVLANTSQAAGILSGMRIQVTGRWRQARAVASSIDEAADDRSGGAAGGAEAAAGQPAGSFQVHAITAHWPDSRPMPLQSISAEPGNAVVAAATAGTVSPAAAATLSTNGLVAAELSVLVIPSERCPQCSNM